MRLKLLPLLLSLVLGAGLSLLAQSINGSGIRVNGTTQKEFVNVISLGNGTSAAPSLTWTGNAFDGFYWVSAGNFGATANGTPIIRFGVFNGMTLANNGALSFTNSTNPQGTISTVLSSATAGMLQIGTTGLNALGTINAAAYQTGNAKGVGFAFVHAKPANQPGNATSTLLMNGLGAAAAPCIMTPAATGRIIFVITGDIDNGTLADGVSYNMAFGPGTPPANAAAATGAILTASRVFTQAVGGELTPFTLLASTTASATLAVPLWFDMQIADLTGGTAAVQNVDCTAWEF